MLADLSHEDPCGCPRSKYLVFYLLNKKSIYLAHNRIFVFYISRYCYPYMMFSPCLVCRRSLCLPACRFAYQLVSFLPVSLPVCLSVCLPVCQSASLSVCLSVCLPVCLPFYQSVCLPVCLSLAAFKGGLEDHSHSDLLLLFSQFQFVQVFSVLNHWTQMLLLLGEHCQIIRLFPAFLWVGCQDKNSS